MKKTLLTAAMTATLFAIGTQTTFAHNLGGEKKAKKKAKHEHTCSKACTADMHAYKHGEKGHKCIAECHKK